MQIDVRIQPEDFSLDIESRRLLGLTRGAGAIASFVGYVRGNDGGKDIKALELEHYPGMTEKSIRAMIEEAGQRWDLLACTVIHRIGHLESGVQIVLVMVASAHRGESFAACEFVMDYLKSQAPLWKKEITEDGDAWVDAKQADQDKAGRW